MTEYHIVLSCNQVDLLMNVLGCVEAQEKENGLECDEITALAAEIERQTFAEDKLADKPVYGPMCRNPKACAGKGYCPLDPTCAD